MSILSLPSRSAPRREKRTASDGTTKEYVKGEPRQIDVPMGSKKKSFTRHPGSQRFQDIVDKRRAEYHSTPIKTTKTAIIREIVNEVMSNGAMFMKKDEFGWYIPTLTAVCDKVGHAMRFESAADKRKRSLGHHRTKSASLVSVSEDSIDVPIVEEPMVVSGESSSFELDMSDYISVEPVLLQDLDTFEAGTDTTSDLPWSSIISCLSDSEDI